MSGEEILEKARAYEKNLLNFFWRRGVSNYEGEDLVQETYLRLWNYRETYQPTASFKTFLFMIAQQVRIDALRRQTRRENREECWGKEQPTTETPTALCAREEVRWAVGQLSDPLRDVIELAVLQELPYAEVGEILGIPVGTVKSRVSNAMKKLKEIFDVKRS